MCGIAGFIDQSGMQYGDWTTTAQRMSDSIDHRGPDDGGVWIDTGFGVGLAHRRLSVLDLSSAGHQPMMSACERYVFTFNGEIYNHLDLRRELQNKGHLWRGHSDTETLLAGFGQWGIKATLEKTVGMFALAVWDRKRQTLTLARDRLGEKPLYYGWQGGVFLFGSELGALKVHPAFCGEIDRGALSLFLRHNYIPVPYSIYLGIRKLLPGTLVEFAVGERAMAAQTFPEPQAYWSVSQAMEQGLAHPFAGDELEAVDALERLLVGAVRRQIVADVPLGAFLSGGVDSSAVVALMQAQSTRPVKTFSIGFHEEAHNEAEYAKAVARHLGTEHTDLYVTPQQAMAVISKLPKLYSEPFADPSQIPTYLVSALARRHVAVSLSGDGGDELFCGYDRYSQAANLWNRLSRLPLPLRAAIRGSLSGVSVSAWSRLLAPVMSVIPRRYRRWNIGDKLHKLAEILDSSTAEVFYQQFVSHWKSPEDTVIGGAEPSTTLTGTRLFVNAALVETFMAKDMVSYLPDDILVKVDRAAMALSLETRAPYLDHQVVEFACQLPLSMKVRDGQSKWILRQVLYKYVPKALIDRPKMGFGVPIDSWLRGPLRDWAEDLLSETRLKREGFFNSEPIRQKWTEHLSGQRNWQYHLWSVLMFQAWLEASRA